jgi:8-oxo-dGTP diphosphatase
MEKEIIEKFGNRVRIRACGLCWKDNHLLLINHIGLSKGNFWAPPGGGIEFGQLATEALIREFFEETGLNIKPLGLQFVCEYVNPPLHAVELFFGVQVTGGFLRQGSDPEMMETNQIIKEVEFLSWDEILRVNEAERHGIFRFCSLATDLKKMTGFYRI